MVQRWLRGGSVGDKRHDGPRIIDFGSDAKGESAVGIS